MKKKNEIKYGIEITKPHSKDMYSHNDMVAKEMKVDHRFWRPIERVVRFRKMMEFYPNPTHGHFKKLINSIFEIFKH